MMSPLKQRITLVRHAEPISITPFMGRTDVAVLPQANQALAQSLNGDYDLIVSSPLQRCAGLAELLAERQAQKNPIPTKLIADLQERDWGAWDGLSPDQIDPSELAAYYQSPFDYPIPQAESLTSMQQRVHQAWCSLLQTAAGDILCITHGGVMRVVLQQIFNLSNEALFQLKFDYGSRLVLEVTSTETAPFVQLIEIRQGTL